MASTNEYNYHPADLLGNVTVPRLTLPTIRSAKRRNDADGISTVPYYPGINAKKLDIEYTDNALVVQSVSLTIAGTGYQDLIDDIKALDPTNLEAIDMGGFLGIRNTNSGSTHYVKILPQGVPGDEAAALLGLETDPMPGSISYAGELASTPGHRSQQNPQGATLISKGDDLQADAFNRAFVSIIREIEKLRADLERETIGYVDVVVTVQNHEISSGVKGFYLNDATIRLPIRNIDPSTAAGFMEGYVTLLDATTKREVYNVAEKVQGLRVHYATAATALQTGAGFATWGTPDGGHIYDGTIPTKEKHASVTITSIKGSVLYCAGATFTTKLIQKNDALLISGATNTSPFDHNGWFAVVDVLDEEHIRVRPFGTNENIPAVGPQETPFALNPLGSGFGDITIYFGDFVPASSMFVSLQNGPGISNGTYYARIACGRSSREPKVERPFTHNGDPSAAISAHVNDATDAHASTAISGFTSATTWFNGTNIGGATLKATIEDILTDLASLTGTARIGSGTITATGFTVPFSISSGGLSTQLAALLTTTQLHETNSSFHPESGVVSGFSQGVYSFPNLPVNGGTLVAEYLGQKRVFVVTGTSFSLVGNQLYHIYVDLTDGLLKITQTATVAFAATAFPLYYLFTQGFGITWSSDFRVPLASSYARQKGFVTVGPSGSFSDFPNLADACDWISWYRGASGAGPTPIPKTWEIVVQGNIVMDRVSGAFNFPMTIRGASLDGQGTPLCSITVSPGTFSHQVGGALALGTIPDGVSGVIVRDLRFITPTTTTTTNNPTINISYNTYEATHWLIDNCIFSGGTNAPFIKITNTLNFAGVPKHLTIRNCWFKDANNRTTENPLVLIQKSQDCLIENCRFEGSTANILTNGIRFEGTTDAGSAYGHMVRNCTFELGGRHIITTQDVDSVTVAGCTFRSSRATAINHTSTGELFINDCKFIGCMTNSSVAEAVIWSDTGNGRLDVKNCRFKNWATGYAIRGLPNTSKNSQFVNNVFTATAVDRVIIGFSDAVFSGNDIDLSPGASSGNGHDIAVVVSLGNNCRVHGNYFRNCGSNGTASSDTVVACTNTCTLIGNNFNNCRGTLFYITGNDCIVTANACFDCGNSANDRPVDAVTNFRNYVYGNNFQNMTEASRLEKQFLFRLHQNWLAPMFAAWTSVQQGGGTVAMVVNQAADKPGPWLRLRCFDNIAPDIAAKYSEAFLGGPLAARIAIAATFYVDVTSIAGLTEDYYFHAGFCHDEAGGGPASTEDFVKIQKDDTNANWKFRTGSPAGVSTTTTTTVSAGGVQKFRIEIVGSQDPNGARAILYIDDILRAIHTTNLPADDQSPFAVALVNTGEGAGQHDVYVSPITIDYLRIDA